MPSCDLSSLKGRRVLVTGAGGFIGSHLAERLVRLGARTRAMVHYNALNRCGWLEQSEARADLEIFAGDLCDRDSVLNAARDVEIIFHLGALIAIPYSYAAPASYLRVNAEGTLNVLQAARLAGVRRMVHTSTSEVYGTAQQVPITEEHPLQGQSPYSASKIAADKMVEAFYRSFEVPAVIVRPFNTYGPRQSARAILPTIILQCLAGERVRLGHTHPTRDLNFVEDIVEGFLRAGLVPGIEGKTIQLGSGREISIRDLALLVARLAGQSIELDREEVRARPLASEVERLVADASRAREWLGWVPAVSLEDGVARTLEWFKAHRRLYPADTYVV